MQAELRYIKPRDVKQSQDCFKLFHVAVISKIEITNQVYQLCGIGNLQNLT